MANQLEAILEKIFKVIDVTLYGFDVTFCPKVYIKLHQVYINDVTVDET